MPKTKIGGQIRSDNKITYIPDKGKCSTEDPARHIYKKVEMDKIINVDTLKQEIEDDRVTRNGLKEEEEEIESNPYQMAILNKTSRDDTKIEQMINWSIPSDSIKYIDGSSCSDMTPNLTVKPLDYRKHKRLYNSLKSDKDLTSDVIFEAEIVEDVYFDKYDGIYVEISQATRFDESTDLSTRYLGKTDITRDQSYYIQCKSLHTLPKFASTTQRIQAGNGQCVAVLFVMHAIVDKHGHRFEVFMLVSEVHDNVDMVLGMKNVFELEGVIDTLDL